MEIETEGIKIKFDDGTEYRLPDICSKNSV